MDLPHTIAIDTVPVAYIEVYTKYPHTPSPRSKQVLQQDVSFHKQSTPQAD